MSLDLVKTKKHIYKNKNKNKSKNIKTETVTKPNLPKSLNSVILYYYEKLFIQV